MSRNDSDVKHRGRLRRVTSFALWYLLPSLVVLGTLFYMYSALVVHVNPPFVAVQGESMHPTLVTGELVILEKANPATLKRGDIIAVHVAPSARTTYGLPANVVHRIVRIEHTSTGLLFITKGDANPGDDVFQTTPGDIAGKLHFVIPGAGYPILFIQSRQGEIFLGSVVLVGLFYFLFGLYEERRKSVRSTVMTMQAVLAEAQRLERLVSIDRESSFVTDASPRAALEPSMTNELSDDVSAQREPESRLEVMSVKKKKGNAKKKNKGTAKKKKKGKK